MYFARKEIKALDYWYLFRNFASNITEYGIYLTS